VAIYPETYAEKPSINSPARINDSIEAIVVLLKTGDYAVVPVTVEHGKPLMYSYRLGTYMGKDNQLAVNTGDFPELGRSGLHDENWLDNKTMITGVPVDVINCVARPNGYSRSGFIAEDEDIISVLKGDNQLVRSLGFTHQQMAIPVFHIWNMILFEIESGNWARFYDNIQQIVYNGNVLNFKASGSKGWQQSIFFDEIQGRYNIHIDRDFTDEELIYLKQNYAELSDQKIAILKDRLSRLDISEMLPYYIHRYGFYEGHVDYRCDPLAIVFIFGLRSLEEIDEAVEGKLFISLTDHYTSEATDNRKE
jgi:hypothetical protein